MTNSLDTDTMDTDHVYQVTEEVYEHFLEITPAVKWPEKGYPMQGDGGFAFAEGREPIVLFWRVSRDDFFAQKTSVINHS